MRKNLIKKRKEKGLTQDDMSKLLNVSRPNYTAYELGTINPPLDRAIKIKKILQCDDDNIFLNENVSYSDTT